MLNLVSDSSCDLISGELNSPYARLTVAPMCLHVGGQDYLDTPELDIPALLSKLAHHRSSSACPSPAAYAEAFEQGEETVCVTISSQLSGSYNAAMAARDLVLAEHPEKKIFVLDSRATSGAMILLLRKAAELAEQRLPFEDLCAELQVCQKNTRLCFTLEHFDNLVTDAASGRHPAPDAGHPHCRGSHGRGYDPRGQKGPWRGPHRQSHRPAHERCQGLHRQPCDHHPLSESRRC